MSLTQHPFRQFQYLTSPFLRPGCWPWPRNASTPRPTDAQLTEVR
jgi:hypothetical protein